MIHAKRIVVVLLVVVSGFVVQGKAGNHKVAINPGATCKADQDPLTVCRSKQETIVWQLSSPATAPYHQAKVRFKSGPAGATMKTPCSGTNDFDVPQHPGSSKQCTIAKDTPPGLYTYEILDASGKQCKDPTVDVQNGGRNGHGKKNAQPKPGTDK